MCNSHAEQLRRIACPSVRREVVEGLLAFHTKIRGLREEQGLCLGEAASDMGFTKQVLDLYENGKNFPSTQKLLTIACYYGVSLDWLFGRDI